MDELDKKILVGIQFSFPIATKPYWNIADRLGITEEEVISRIKRLKVEGKVRRIGAVFDSRRLGYSSTLVAAKVPSERLEEVARIISGYPEVTHNYQREDELNLWFTLTASSKERIESIIQELKRRTGIKEMFDLPAINMFKIRAVFNPKNRL